MTSNFSPAIFSIFFNQPKRSKRFETKRDSFLLSQKIGGKQIKIEIFDSKSQAQKRAREFRKSGDKSKFVITKRR